MSFYDSYDEKPRREKEYKMRIGRWTEMVILLMVLGVTFYVGFLEGSKTPASCVIPMKDGNALELRKMNP